MKKQILLMVSILGLCACATWQQQQVDWRGRNFDDYVQSKGVPTSKYSLQNGNTVYSFKPRAGVPGCGLRQDRGPHEEPRLRISRFQSVFAEAQEPGVRRTGTYHQTAEDGVQQGILPRIP